MDYVPEYFIGDSGAFTAWSIGKPVDIDEYVKWSKEQMAKYPRVVSVNLDVIPGEKGRNSTKEERDAGMRKSVENADYLRSKGLDIMEVFHQDEPREFLDELLDRLPENGILGISPRNDVSVKAKLEWQKVLLSHLSRRFTPDKMPRTHGLAVTSPQMLQEFPYYSADSSSWAGAARFGTLIGDNGKSGKGHVPDGHKVTRKESRAFIDNMLRTSIVNQMRLGEQITSLWESRGVKWSN